MRYHLTKPNKLGLVSVFLFVLLMNVCDSYAPNADGSKYREVERLWTQLPPYPGSVESHKWGKNEPTVATSGRQFTSDVSYEDLRKFYAARLSGEGWQIEREERATGWLNRKTSQRLYLSRGEYVISIEYSGPQGDYEWNYAINISWREA